MEQSKTDYNQVFGSPAGKRVLDDILSFAHVVEPPACESDPHVVMFKAGRRDIGMFILQQMNKKDIAELIK